MVDLSTTFRELEHLPELKGLSQYIVYSGGMGEADRWLDAKLETVERNGWNAEAMCTGINLLIEQKKQYDVGPYFIYKAEECAEDPQKKDVNLICLRPEKQEAGKPYVILVSGGGYMNVCNGAEAFPTAFHMLARGYLVFVLNYRVGRPPVLTKALADLASALRYIRLHAQEFDISEPDEYLLAGFSAGANLVSTWGTANAGYKVCGLPKPKALFPVYTLVDLKALAEQQKAEQNAEKKQGIRWDGLTVMLGERYTADTLEKYNVAEHIDEEYPPCYIVCGEDDMTVDPSNSRKMKACLDRAGVPAVLETGKHAPHGFGDGTETDVEGWPERALDFSEGLSRKYSD